MNIECVRYLDKKITILHFEPSLEVCQQTSSALLVTQ